MCDPISATALVVASTAMSTAGTIFSGVQKAQEANYQAEIASQDAQITAQQTQDAEQRAVIDQRNLDRQYAQKEGAQRAAMAANGVDLGFGSAASVQSDTMMQRNEDASSLYHNESNEIRGYDFNMANYLAEEAANRQQAQGAIVGAAFGVGTSILGGATQLSKIQNPKAWGLPGRKNPC